METFTPTLDWGNELWTSLWWIAQGWAYAAVATMVVLALIVRFTTWGRQFWRVTRGYFTGPESLIVWIWLAVILLLVILSLYFLQGLAIVRYYFGVKGTPSILRGMGYFMLLAYFPLRLLLAGVGVFDLWIDFRKPRIRKD